MTNSSNSKAPQHACASFLTGVVGNCTVSVLQPGYLEVDYTSKAVTMECTFSTTGCSSKQPRSLWFRCGTHQPEALCLDGCRNEADKFTVKETLDQNRVSLTVNRVSPNDSAIYICGIAFPQEVTPRAKQTGNGTTLVVRESLNRHVHSLLIVLLTLLSVYITGVCVIFIVFFKVSLILPSWMLPARGSFHLSASETAGPTNTWLTTSGASMSEAAANLSLHHWDY